MNTEQEHKSSSSARTGFFQKECLLRFNICFENNC